MVNPRPLYSRGPRSPHRCVSGSCRTRCRLVSPVPEADSTKGQRKKRSQDGWGRHTSRRIALRAHQAIQRHIHCQAPSTHSLTHHHATFLCLSRIGKFGDASFSRFTFLNSIISESIGYLQFAGLESINKISLKAKMLPCVHVSCESRVCSGIRVKGYKNNIESRKKVALQL
jgi:hypothetical protein